MQQKNPLQLMFDRIDTQQRVIEDAKKEGKTNFKVFDLNGDLACQVIDSIEVYTELNEGQKKLCITHGFTKAYHVSNEDQEIVYNDFDLTSCINYAKTNRVNNNLYIGAFVK